MTDSIEMILRKAKALYTVNSESLAFINSTKGRQVLTCRNIILEPKLIHCKKDNNKDDSCASLISRDTKKDVNLIIENWSYKGQPLIKESIAMDYFIDTRIESFKDLQRMQEEYKRLIESYTDLLKDEQRSRKAASILLTNMEILQVAIGSIHKLVMDIADSSEEDLKFDEDMKAVMESLQKISSRGLSFQVNLKRVTFRTRFRVVPNFNDISKVHLTRTLNAHTEEVCCLELFTFDGKQYLASGSGDNTIKIWSLNDYYNMATLTDHEGYVRTLKSYEHKGVPMLASGGDDKSIKLWDLSKKSIVNTLSGHTSTVYSLETYDYEEKTNLVSGSSDGFMILWDLDTHQMLITLNVGVGQIYDLKVLYQDNEPYVIIGGKKGCSMWSLSEQKKEKQLQGTEVYSLHDINHDGSLIMAFNIYSHNNYSQIQAQNLENGKMIHLTNCNGFGGRLEFVYNNGKLCLVVLPSGASTMQVWDFESRTNTSTISNNETVSLMKGMKNDGLAYLVTGHSNGKIQFWTE